MHDTPDLAPITRHLRAMYSSRLLVGAVCHLNVFEQFADGPLTPAELAKKLDLKDRPAKVLLPALRAMGLLESDASGRLSITRLGESLTRGEPANIIDYLGLEQHDAGVVEMVARLRNDGSSNPESGTAYILEGAEASPMDDPEQARFLTMALSGRAGRLAPLFAEKLPRRTGHLLDIAGGTGLFAYEWLRINPQSTATVLDRPEVLKVAGELLDAFSRGGRDGTESVRRRVEFKPGNMLTDELPGADVIFAASLFHDWPEPTCETLARRFAAALKPGGELWIHDAFLNDTMDGPLAVTDYSAQLFWVTKGRCYSRAEYRRWFREAGLLPTDHEIATAMDYGMICARKA